MSAESRREPRRGRRFGGRRLLLVVVVLAAAAATAIAFAAFGHGAPHHQADTGHRGGTLRVEFPNSYAETGAIDPAFADDADVVSVLSLTNDGLVAFRRTGGVAGTELVPDLAVALPAPTDGGRTYAFRLRKGIRYSTGENVTASDVASSLIRLFALDSNGSAYFDGIVGAPRCELARSVCLLSRGIVADDRAGTVVFHLTKPDPEFLYELATQYALVVPAGTPGPEERPLPLPATGPYEIATEVERGGAVTARLVRNPFFDEWSRAAKPDGYPDQIVVRWPRNSSRTDLALGRGAVDVAPDEPARVVSRHPGVLHRTPDPETAYWVLDTTRPPFDDVRARRAVAYAVDRARAARDAAALGFAMQSSGIASARPTCQVLPPTVVGYRPYCPFGRAPDLAGARALVRESGTAGAHVAVLVETRPLRSGPVARFARETLEPLGYHVSYIYSCGLSCPDTPTGPQQLLPPDPSKPLRARLPQMVFEPPFGLGPAGYPSPSQSFAPLRCRTSTPPGCSRSLDHMIRRTLALQSRDRGAAASAWAKVDRRATNLAQWIPLFTPVTLDLVSNRVGDFRRNPFYGVLFDRLWVR